MIYEYAITNQVNAGNGENYKLHMMITQESAVISVSRLNKQRMKERARQLKKRLRGDLAGGQRRVNEGQESEYQSRKKDVRQGSTACSHFGR